MDNQEGKAKPQQQQTHVHREIKVADLMPKVYAIGAAGGFTPYDFRILFFDAGRYQPEGRVEVTLSPLAAKELRDWLDGLVKDYEKKVRKIEKPQQQAEGKKDGSPPGSPSSSMRMFG